MMKDRLTTLLAQIEMAVRQRRDPHLLKSPLVQFSPLLVAVSKRQPLEKVKEAYHLGIRDFGENYVQALAQRRNELEEDVNLHLIGKVQTNKIRKALDLADWIHSIYSLKNLQKFEYRIRQREAKDPATSSETKLACVSCKPILLLQVDPSDQGEKGMNWQEFKETLTYLQDVEGLRYWIRGVMTIAPRDASNTQLHWHFSETRRMLFELLKLNPQAYFFSAGMSNDFQIAIQEGANVVRIGTALFGPRPA